MGTKGGEALTIFTEKDSPKNLANLVEANYLDIIPRLATCQQHPSIYSSTANMPGRPCCGYNGIPST